MIDAQDDLLLMGKQSLACMGLLCCQAADALLCFLLVTNPKTKQCKQLRGRSPCCLPDLSLSLTHTHTPSICGVLAALWMKQLKFFPIPVNPPMQEEAESPEH